MTTETATRFIAPGRADRIFNAVVSRLTRRGLSLWGSRILEVRGRKTGEWRSTPVNLLTVDGADYLVAPRGNTHWVRNMRVAGAGRLRVGRRIEDFTAVEVDDADKPEILREYLRKWAWEVGRFFEGASADSTTDELLALAPGFPVFRVKRVIR